MGLPKKNIRNIFSLYVAAFMCFSMNTGNAVATEETAADLIFTKPYVKMLSVPSKVEYSYKHETKTPDAFGSNFEEFVLLNVEVPPESAKFNSVSINIQSEKKEFNLGPFVDNSGNPVIMFFLEREMRQMRSKVGGTPVYFRNTIRKAFRDGAKISDVKIKTKNGEIDGKKIVIEPFEDEANLGKFGKYQDKVFETIVADELPGGIYSMRSYIPDKTGEQTSLVTNELLFQELK